MGLSGRTPPASGTAIASHSVGSDPAENRSDRSESAEQDRSAERWDGCSGVGFRVQRTACRNPPRAGGSRRIPCRGIEKKHLPGDREETLAGGSRRIPCRGIEEGPSPGGSCGPPASQSRRRARRSAGAPAADPIGSDRIISCPIGSDRIGSLRNGTERSPNAPFRPEREQIPPVWSGIGAGLERNWSGVEASLERVWSGIEAGLKWVWSGVEPSLERVLKRLWSGPCAALERARASSKMSSRSSEATDVSPPLRVITSHFSGVVTTICVSASSFLLSCMSPVSSRTWLRV